MKFGIIKERSNTSDKRVLFSPDALSRLQSIHQDISIKVESSENRAFTDDDYKNMNIEIAADISDCDVFFGVDEVPAEYLIPNKSYFFFSKVIKKQQFNGKLLQALLDKNINFYEIDSLVNDQNIRLIDNDKHVGFVGAYNSLRAFGIKFELFKLPKATSFAGKQDLIAHLKRLVLPPIKIVSTGSGKVGTGVKEILEAIKIKEVSVENYLKKNYTQPVYIQIDVLDYNVRKDGQVLDVEDFYQHPMEYVSNFERFTKVSDIYISGHFHAVDGYNILTREMLNAKDCKIKVVADISCDVNDSIACTLRKSTIDEPLYGYWPLENREVDVFHPAAIVVMAVDNLSCELPKETIENYGTIFIDHIIPAFFNGDKDGILQSAKITDGGELTPQFHYLTNDGLEK
jgi:hypothetical protein